MSNSWGKVVFIKKRNSYAVRGQWQGKRLFFSEYHSDLGRKTCKTEQEALQLQMIISNEISQGRFNPLRYKKTKPLALRNYAEKWLEQIRSSISFGTWSDYKSSLKLHILPVLGDIFLPDIGYDDLLVLLSSIKREPKGKRNVFGCLHRLIVDARRAGHISQLPEWIEFRGTNEVVPPPVEYISTQDQMTILNHIPLQHRYIFMFMMATGCRPSEARAFRKQDIKGNHILFAKTFGRGEQLKEVKQKVVKPWPMTQEVIEILKTVPKNFTRYVFINPVTSKPYTKNINRIWNKACKQADVEPIRLNKATRHSFACGLLKAGVDLATVSRLLNHSDIRTTKRYTEFNLISLQSAAEKVTRFPEMETKVETVGNLEK